MATRDVLSYPVVTPESFPVESTRVLFLVAVAQCMCIVQEPFSTLGACCFPFPCDSSLCTQDCVFPT